MDHWNRKQMWKCWKKPLRRTKSWKHPEADSSADESPPETTAPDKELSELLVLSGEEL